MLTVASLGPPSVLYELVSFHLSVETLIPTASSGRPTPSLAHETHDHLNDVVAARGHGLHCRQVAIEDQAEGMLVRNIEEGQRRNRGVDVDRIEWAAEHALRHAAAVELADSLDHRHVELLDALALGQVLATLHVLGRHQSDVVLVARMMVEGEPDQSAQRILGRKVLQVQFGFDGAHAPVGLLENGDVQPLLALEVVVNHALAGPRRGGDGVYARAAQALIGELGRRHLHDPGHGAQRIVGAARWRFPGG